MIQTRFYTFIVRKDVLTAKWPGGVEGFKADINFEEAYHQEDEALIAYGYSWGTDLDLFFNLVTEKGLVVSEKREVLRKAHTIVSRSKIALYFLGAALAFKWFGRMKLVQVAHYIDVALVGGPCGGSCDWLIPAAPGCVRFL